MKETNPVGVHSVHFNLQKRVNLLFYEAANGDEDEIKQETDWTVTNNIRSSSFLYRFGPSGLSLSSIRVTVT